MQRDAHPLRQTAAFLILLRPPVHKRIPGKLFRLILVIMIPSIDSMGRINLQVHVPIVIPHQFSLCHRSLRQNLPYTLGAARFRRIVRAGPADGRSCGRQVLRTAGPVTSIRGEKKV
ncbi:hypothetical protein HFQ13_10595 [Acidithiobacillus sp. VAN18-1]|uniref:Uncharacterized protein n=1 Tax=Igneacidithiobacillus copahuensis TaxID=2724909 RepID=A0AAE2YQR0_9PROT|nr:hypothetical protein [Igneacidithiobacillus copahuensis]MBU2788639.1 hypothetical protein [Igneacidithiobacillus copahuensis]MBU2796677.1 hypothetical protein [Acidithiobacillus sp. VAN18-2]